MASRDYEPVSCPEYLYRIKEYVEKYGPEGNEAEEKRFKEILQIVEEVFKDPPGSDDSRNPAAVSEEMICGDQEFMQRWVMFRFIYAKENLLTLEYSNMAHRLATIMIDSDIIEEFIVMCFVRANRKTALVIASIAIEKYGAEREDETDEEETEAEMAYSIQEMKIKD